MARRIHLGGLPINFGEIQNRLMARIRAKIQNGEVTERGLARTAGISQPHINKVLKGTRNLSMERSDAILAGLHLSLLDLISEPELRQQAARIRAASEPCIEMPFLDSRIGPGLARTAPLEGNERHSVPCWAAGLGGNLVARLADDPWMEYSSQGWNICLIATTKATDVTKPDALYIIDRGADIVLRKIRRGYRRLYLLTDADADHPELWEALPMSETVAQRILGRVVWFGREEQA